MRTLIAGNRELCLGTTQAQKDQLTALGINALASAERAQLLSTTSVYSADGQRETDTYGPLHQVTLAARPDRRCDHPRQAGSQVMARQHTVKEYDTGRPTDGTASVKNQVTKQTVGAQLRSWPDLLADTRVTATAYDWAKGLPTSTTQDPGGLGITTTGYEDQGRVIKASQPASSRTDAGTTVTSYYTGDRTGTCGGHPEWADAVRRTGPAAAITGGGSNPGFGFHADGGRWLRDLMWRSRPAFHLDHLLKEAPRAHEEALACASHLLRKPDGRPPL
ncbi:hypothetical protein [Streptomyces antibioticus]|uniref:hypothetical protein n=1 Tax=Streptomyces antibioticus TaxID=1890 RepID=UPI0033FBD3A7